MCEPCSEGIEIVQAREPDTRLLAPMFDAYRQFYGEPSDLDAAAAFLIARLRCDESVIYFARVRHKDEAPQAGGFLQLFPSFSSVSLCHAWTLNDLYVNAAFRKRGIGQMLLERAMKHCCDTGAGQLWLQTDVDNAGAQRLYESAGMSQHEIFEYTRLF